MTSLLATLLLMVLSWRQPAWPLFDHPVYVSAKEPRAELALSPVANAAPPKKKDRLSLGPRLSAQSALLVDKLSGAVLYDLNSRAVRPLASLTKLMTALIFLEAKPDLSQMVAMKPADDREGGQTFIRPGESADLESYLRASLIGSANNATMVLSRSTGQSSAEFVQAMNNKARALGMRETNFVDPTGLAVGNQSRARDLLWLLRAAGDEDLIKKLTTTSQDSLTVYPSAAQREIKNTDHLLGSIVRIVLGKTGYLDEAQYNLAAVIKLGNGREVYAVVLGAASSDERFQDMKNLAVWAAGTYEWP